MVKRPTAGRALFYTRDSGGKHETTPGEYVGWAQKTANQYALTFDGTPSRIEAMIRDGRPCDGDLFLDYGVTGNKLTRVGLDALIAEVLRDERVSHLMAPRRDRLFRPDDPIDAMQFERRISEIGVTLIFMDRVVKPVLKGHRVDLGESICAYIEYNYAGEFRRDLAQKMIHAQIALAKDGYSTGGRPPYGFRRWQVRVDGTAVRELAEGERVKRAGHHVAWLPGPEEELAVIRRILTLLETLPASRIAAMLTREGVPTPDAGRSRTDRGVVHQTSGTWSQATITNIARNPLLLAIVTYGRRSMGDQLRFTPGGPRHLEDEDHRPDGQPKVIMNSEANQIKAGATFDPIVDPARHKSLLENLDARAGTQRGKPRSKNPAMNPLGTRMFDMTCGWPMYREPYNGSFRYVCGHYQQSHGASCRHNHVDGPATTRFLMRCIRQRVMTKSFRERLEEKLRTIAQHELGDGRPEPGLALLRTRLGEVSRNRQTAATNLALADGPAQYKAIAGVFETLLKEENRLEAELKAAENSVVVPFDVETEVQAALKTVDRLADSEPAEGDLAAAGDLFRVLNVRLFLDFMEITPKKRTVNVVSKGVVTFGSAPAPVALYKGPTGRRALQADRFPETSSGRSVSLIEEENPGRGGMSSGNVNRGGGI